MAKIRIPDPGERYTDEEIKLLDKKIQSIYSEAQRDIQSKMDDFNQKFEKKDAIYRKQLEKKEITQEQYDSWKKGQVFTGKQWAAKKDEITKTLNNSNKLAVEMINNAAPGVFAENGNYMAYGLEHTAGVSFGFNLYNTQAVTRLIKDDPDILPKWKINEKKDYTWNKQSLNNAVTQGIIQGESLDKISKRVGESLAGKNENLMKTFAKTGMTQAQNSGRLERLKQADTLGIECKKKWVATLDARTRMTHQALDGQVVPTNEAFEVPGAILEYPGDPSAPAKETYNCRCALTFEFEKYPSDKYQRRDNIAGKPIDKMTYREWKASKKSEAKKPGDKSTKKSVSKISSVITGKDISKTWIRRPNEFDFAIEDIINAQGFDGLPRVVNAEEFDRYVQESNIIMQRGYRAPNEETLKAYQDTLYNGKWYVDCSEGGSIYGKGMYTVYNKGTTIIDDIADTAKDYARPSRLRGLNAGTIETITLTSDAKIIKYEEIKDMLSEYNKIHSKIDEGSLAALYGYDAISVGQNDMGYLVILNRTKLIIKENTL